jgi:hypothetical protein
VAANKPKPDHEELRLLYQVTVGDLTYFKTQQWSVTNYSMLLFAGLVGVAQLLKPNLTTVDRTLLVAAVVFVFAAALVVLYKLQTSILVRQARLDAVREQFTDEFHVAWAAEEKGTEVLHSIFLLRLAVVGGGGLAAWLIGMRL